MDRNCPSNYVEMTSSSLSTTQSWLRHFDKYPSGPSSSTPLVQPILTPRFAISCTPELLSALGKIAASRTPSFAIQTHLSENKSEVALTKELFPDCRTYAGVYEKFGLLGPGTILAHCVHLDDEERDVISRSGAGISHCPTSNVHLNSGAAEVAKMLEAGIKVSPSSPYVSSTTGNLADS
jgi:guanine deaminase